MKAGLTLFLSLLLFVACKETPEQVTEVAAMSQVIVKEVPLDTGLTPTNGLISHWDSFPPSKEQAESLDVALLAKVLEIEAIAAHRLAAQYYDSTSGVDLDSIESITQEIDRLDSLISKLEKED